MKNIFPELLPIGTAQKSHGFDGTIKIKLDLSLIKSTLFPKYVWFVLYGKPVPFEVLSFKLIEESTLLLKFEDVDSEDKANALRNLDCYCEELISDRYFLPLESYDYLLGMLVIDKTKGELGKIIDVIENENSHATIALDMNGTEILIPFVDEMVIAINEKKMVMTVDLPEGLIELYFT